MGDFNENQLSTLSEAEATLAELQALEFAAGHAPVSVDLPEWSGPFPEPHIDDSLQYCILFQTGQEMNVGLIRTFKTSYPASWQEMIISQANNYQDVSGS